MNTADPSAGTGAPAAAQAAAAPAASKTLCANCGSELLGAHCYACGQPVKGMVRHLGSILHDVADTILNIDSRIFRTLFPLYFRPGFLSNEYFAGRRVRYVTPFRLYFFLSVAAFLLIQLSLDSSLDLAKNFVRIDDSAMATASTPAEVEARRDEMIAELNKARATSGMPEEAEKGLARAEAEIRKQADKRLAKIAALDKAALDKAGADKAGTDKARSDKARPDKDPPDKTGPAIEINTEDSKDANKSGDDEKENFNIEIGGKKWDPKTDPVKISWLPQFVNAKLNNAAVHIVDNLPRIKKDPKPFLLGAVGVLPQVLFVLMPLFALLLKVFFIFKRRLYMEHLIVALHSHSFIFISMILITLLILLRGWARASLPLVQAPLGLLVTGMCWWLPLYLFLMQKKVYKQGWFFTTVKFGMIGLCYTIMITFGVVAALIVSLATT